jgi:uncharacterized spore protein YtfJ
LDNRHAKWVLILILIGSFIATTISCSAGAEPPKDINEKGHILLHLEKDHGRELVLGDPLIVDRYRIIPVTRVRVGKVTGGSIHPMGIVVISPEGFEFIRIHESVAGQIVERLPGLVRSWNNLIFKNRTEVNRPRVSMAELVASVLLLTPEKVLGIGIATWWVQKLIFICAWFILAFITARLLFSYIERMVDNIRRKPFASILYGLSGSMILVFFSAVMTLTIIGIPLSFLLIGCYLIASFMGRVSLGVLLGGLVTGGTRKGRAISPYWIIPGGALIAASRMIPVIGWIIWLLLGVWGFGGIILSLGTNRKQNMG